MATGTLIGESLRPGTTLDGVPLTVNMPSSGWSPDNISDEQRAAGLPPRWTLLHLRGRRRRRRPRWRTRSPRSWTSRAGMSTSTPPAESFVVFRAAALPLRDGRRRTGARRPRRTPAPAACRTRRSTGPSVRRRRSSSSRTREPAGGLQRRRRRAGAVRHPLEQLGERAGAGARRGPAQGPPRPGDIHDRGPPGPCRASPGRWAAGAAATSSDPRAASGPAARSPAPAAPRAPRPCRVEHRLGGDVERAAHVARHRQAVGLGDVVRVDGLEAQAGDVWDDPDAPGPEERGRHERAHEEGADAAAASREKQSPGASARPARPTCSAWRGRAPLDLGLVARVAARRVPSRGQRSSTARSFGPGE